METPKNEVPAGTEFTLIVPLDRKKTKQATFYLKDIDEAIFLAAKDMISKGKGLDAAVFMIKNMRLGGDEVSVFTDNLVAKRSAADLIAEILEPVEGELKKN
jgi:hypothetical protein